MSEQIDSPGLDGTDGAHPAWWRGQDAGAIGAATKIAKAAEEGGHSCEVALANVLRVASEIIDGGRSRTAPLYIEPAWLIEARGWLVRFHAAVEAAGLCWVTPMLVAPDDKYGDNAIVEWSHHFSVEVPDEVKPETWMGYQPAPLYVHRVESADATDIPACVDLYRRWLAERSKA